MNRKQEKVLVATLCGLVIAVAAGFVVQPAMADEYEVQQPAQIGGDYPVDLLEIRRFPATATRPVGSVAPGTSVWVERCMDVPGSADVCFVDDDGQKGWIDSRYLVPLDG